MSVSVAAPLAWRRLAAFALDYVVIFLYLLLALPILIHALDFLATPARSQASGFAFITQGGKSCLSRLGMACGFSTLILPVALYCALSEASERGATLGKRLLGLRVGGEWGERLPLGRSLLRSALKFAPWELAHAASYRAIAAPAPVPWHLAVLALALVLAALYVLGLFSRTQRPLYDRASGGAVRLWRLA